MKYIFDNLIMKSIFRYFRYAIIIVVIVYVFLYMFTHYSNTVESNFFDKNYVQLLGSRVSGSACDLPLDVNPYHASVTPFLTELPKRVECLYENDANNRLTAIESGVLRQQSPNWKCSYQFFDRYDDNDDRLRYEERRTLDPIEGIAMANHSFVAVECEHRLSSTHKYRNTHFYFPLQQNKFANASEERPSVLILVVESLSRLNYLRFMPKTKQSLEQLNVIYLKGLNKMADNSLPNMAPLLTGKRLYNNELDNENFGPYDDWPFVWKRFAQNGYKTALIEDVPTFTLFNYEAKGFQRKPTDFYAHPYWIHIYSEVSNLLMGLMPFQLSNCYNDRFAKIDLILQQIKHFIHQCNHNYYPYFAFAFYIELTHNDFNKAQLIDSHISNFLEEIRNLMNNTILILMGDHGNRFGPVLQTVVGRIEERMPLFAIRIPNHLQQKYPYLQTYLKSNSAKLTTWLDVHQLLMDIANNNYSDVGSNSNQRKLELDRAYYSPWREEIPKWRTCQNAFIPDIFCACDERKYLNVSDEMVDDSALALIQHINAILPHSLCNNLTLYSILYAEAILPSDSIAKPKGFEQRIEVTVDVKPSRAILRAQLSRSAHSLVWSVRGDITRLNKYGNQSHCVHDRTIKLFCFCIDLTDITDTTL